MSGALFRSLLPDGTSSSSEVTSPDAHVAIPLAAFRHGDIEDALAELIKKSGGFLNRGAKWGSLDVKRVYFGNWLRDYSQAMDIAGLSKLSKQTILNLVMALGFLAHGYATAEFEVTDERLGVYLPTEHIGEPSLACGSSDSSVTTDDDYPQTTRKAMQPTSRVETLAVSTLACVRPSKTSSSRLTRAPA